MIRGISFLGNLNSFLETLVKLLKVSRRINRIYVCPQNPRFNVPKTER